MSRIPPDPLNLPLIIHTPHWPRRIGDLGPEYLAACLAHRIIAGGEDNDIGREERSVLEPETGLFKGRNPKSLFDGYFLRCDEARATDIDVVSLRIHQFRIIT